VAVSGNNAFFLAEDGIYKFDGQQVVKLSDRITGFITDRTLTEGSENAMGVFNTILNQYRLFFASDTAPDQDTYDYAMYTDVSGLNVPDADVAEAVTFWPQGRYATTDMGFQATFFAQDSTTPVNRVMMGDRYGFVWEMDFGNYEGTEQPKMYYVSHRIGLGSSNKNFLRWITPSHEPFNQNYWYMDAWPDGLEGSKNSLTFRQSGDTNSLAYFQSATGFTIGRLYAYRSNEVVQYSGSVAIVGKYLILKLYDTSVGDWTLDALEFEVVRQGKRQ
jgi:hypothetical protein